MPSPADHRLPLRQASRWSGLVPRFLVLGFLVLGAALLPADARADDKANSIADRALEAMGGKKAWDDLHFLRFRFAGFRNHHWDKQTGRHRVEFTNRQGDHYVVMQDLDTHVGRAFKNGQELAGEEGKKAVEAAYGTWVNDVYWLLMPYKLREPGVKLSYAGSETIGGVAYDKLELSFDKAGLAPGTRYWAYFNPKTHLMDRWSYLLAEDAPDKAPAVWVWESWKKFGKLLIATGRKSADGDRMLPLDDIAVLDQMPDAVFSDPKPLPEPPKAEPAAGAAKAETVKPEAARKPPAKP